MMGLHANNSTSDDSSHDLSLLGLEVASDVALAFIINGTSPYPLPPTHARYGFFLKHRKYKSETGVQPKSK